MERGIHIVAEKEKEGPHVRQVSESPKSQKKKNLLSERAVIQYMICIYHSKEASFSKRSAIALRFSFGLKPIEELLSYYH